MSAPQGADDVKRLGRAIVFVHQHDQRITAPLIRAQIETLLLTGRAMDFATRLQGHNQFVPLTGPVIRRYASFAGLGAIELKNSVLPVLKSADILDYSFNQSDEISGLEEFVGVSATVTEQTVQVLGLLQPQRSDLAFLHSVEIAALAPLGRAQHLAQVVGRGFSEEEAEAALNLARSVGISQEILSADLDEPVIFSPYVWGTKQVKLASFLEGLPPNERDALLGMSQQVLHTPGLAITSLRASPEMIRSARNAGLIQSATVHSAAGGSSTYAFSPLFEAEDNQLSTTEAFHQRKLFVAHILFGHEKARAGYGQVMDPTSLVDRLIRRGRVGPATNIGTDYHLLEAAGVVAVRPVGDRAYLDLVKQEIAEAALEWIRRITDRTGAETIKLNQSPASFSTPEASREALGGGGEANEIVVASVLELREEMRRAARRDDPWT